MLRSVSEIRDDTIWHYLGAAPLQPRQKPDRGAASRNQLPISQKGSLDSLPPLCPSTPHSGHLNPMTISGRLLHISLKDCEVDLLVTGLAGPRLFRISKAP